MTQKKKIHKLKVEFDDDFQLIGIASHENDYRLTWALNKHLNLNLIKTKNLEINHPKHKINIAYSMYFYEDDMEYLTYALISNKSEKGFLLPEYKNIDFILKVGGNPNMQIVNKLSEGLRKVDIIITAFVLEDISGKNRKVFIS